MQGHGQSSGGNGGILTYVALRSGIICGVGAALRAEELALDFGREFVPRPTYFPLLRQRK
jgi:hypothetical protein